MLLLFAASVLGAHGQSSNPPVRLPEVVVREASPAPLEETLIGPYQQPEWTTERRFTTTRVYLQQGPWEVGFEQWWRGRFFRDSKQAHRFQEEVEVGLPFRTQLDLYETWVSDQDGHMHHSDFDAELRWAPADWGKIPLNPTLYGEWKFASGGPDVFEIKLLLGEELAPRWHWGFNVAWEQEVGGGRATELAWSQGLSYSLIDGRLGAGLEMLFRHETEKGSRSSPEISFLIGPSAQWRPWRNSHLDIVPLLGTTHDSPRAEIYFILGIDFGKSHRESTYAPASLRGQ